MQVEREFVSGTATATGDCLRMQERVREHRSGAGAEAKAGIGIGIGVAAQQAGGGAIGATRWE